MPLHVSSTCAHHQEVKIALHNIWYQHTYRWPSRAKIMCTRRPPIGVMIPDVVQCNFDLLMMSTWCPKKLEAWNKLIVKQKFCASSWLITEIKWHEVGFLFDSFHNDARSNKHQIEATYYTVTLRHALAAEKQLVLHIVSVCL